MCIQPYSCSGLVQGRVKDGTLLSHWLETEEFLVMLTFNSLSFEDVICTINNTMLHRNGEVVVHLQFTFNLHMFK